MKAFLAAVTGAGRPKIIAVFGATRAEVECAVAHAQTGSGALPVWVFCAEKLAHVSGCERVFHATSVVTVRNELRRVWPALSITAWTGNHSAAGLKWLPFTVPPFRVLVLNEAGGFFSARPAAVGNHLKRRLRDASLSGCRRIQHLLAGTFAWARSLASRSATRVWESLLATLAFLAQWTAPLSRQLVQRQTRGQPCGIPLDPARGGRFVEVAISNRGWPRRNVVYAAEQLETDFIVFRMRGEHDNPAPLIALARETNAFAAAKQSAHSAWRQRILPKHPFRQLQPNEASEVFAPFSTLLVVRRDALLRLGIPRALTWGGALMMLFWKASAAGFRSVVAGEASRVPDESAMFLEDAEFAFRLTLSSSMSRLGPLRPARLRGNVAWSPYHRREFRGKPRVLIVSPYLPFPLSHGGAVRIYNLCNAMAQEIDFVLACFREANETVHYDKLHRVFREVYVVDGDEKKGDERVPHQVAEYRNSAMADLIEGLCKQGEIDIVQLEYTQLAEYRQRTGRIPVALVEHDITFTLYRQLADLNGTAEIREQYRRWLAFENEALQAANMIWTVSQEDCSVAVAHGAAVTRTHVIPNGVDVRRFQPLSKSAGPPTILFVGSFRHLPNLLAFESLREQIMPRVWRECPNAVLHVIAGPQHERAAELANKTHLLKSHPQIVLDGFVEDVRPAYRDTDVVAIPLPVSAGTNIKLFEAMACGRAVVSTAAGCRGLELQSGHELIVSAIDESFALDLVNLLRDEHLRARIALEGRRTVERRFGWDAIARGGLRSYSALLAKPIRLASASSAEHVESAL